MGQANSQSTAKCEPFAFLCATVPLVRSIPQSTFHASYPFYVRWWLSPPVFLFFGPGSPDTGRSPDKNWYPFSEGQNLPIEENRFKNSGGGYPLF